LRHKIWIGDPGYTSNFVASIGSRLSKVPLDRVNRLAVFGFRTQRSGRDCCHFLEAGISGVCMRVAVQRFADYSLKWISASPRCPEPRWQDG